jgi:hypothetical protein
VVVNIHSPFFVEYRDPKVKSEFSSGAGGGVPVDLQMKTSRLLEEAMEQSTLAFAIEFRYR